MMSTRRCGTSDLYLSELGVGGWSFGGGDWWGNQSQSDIEKVARIALANGVRYFDTAEAYDDGKSETALGKALKAIPKELRENAIIGTKIGPENCAPDTIRDHLNKSLERLQVDSVDLYMVHWPIDTYDNNDDSKPSVVGAFKVLAKLQQEGLIKNIGISNFGVKQLTEALETGVKIAVHQLAYGLFLRTIELEVMPLCEKHGIGIIAYSPLLQGILTGKYNSLDEVPSTRLRCRHFSSKREGSFHNGPGCEEALWKSLEEIKAIAARERVSMTTLALSWCLKNPLISCIIPGSRNVEQLKINMEAVSYRMSDEVWKELNASTEPVKEHLGTSIDIYNDPENSRSK